MMRSSEVTIGHLKCALCVNNRCQSAGGWGGTADFHDLFLAPIEGLPFLVIVP